jgi:translation initiation factor 2D
MFHKEGSCQGQAGGGQTIPLRKSDRRTIRKLAGEYFSDWRIQEEDVEDDNNNTSQLSQILNAAFLQGTLSSRSIPMDDHQHKTCKMVLYLRSPTNANDNKNNDNNAATAVWPYYESSQFVWMALYEKNQSIPIASTPTVALWAVLTQSSSSSSSLDPLLQVVVQNNYQVQVPSAVSKYICRGAHLMRAGMRSVPILSSSNNDNDTNMRTPPRRPPKMVAICVQGNPMPFAVGRLQENTDQQQQEQSSIGPNARGMGVEIWNAYGDDLWRLQCNKNTNKGGGGTRRMKNNNINASGGASFDNGDYGNVGFVQGTFVYPLTTTDDDEDDDDDDDDVGEDEQSGQITASDEAGKEVVVQAQEAAAAAVQNMQGDTTTLESHAGDAINPENGKDSQPDDTPESIETQQQQQPTPEEILHRAVCQALVSISKQDLPMNVATFYAQHVLPNRPPGSTIQLKATKYKKFGTYLKLQVENGLVKVGPDAAKKDYMAVLVEINRKHEDYVDGLKLLKLVPSEAAAGATSSSSFSRTAGDKKKLVIVSLHMIPQNWTTASSLLRLDPDQVKALHANSEERRGTSMLTGSEVRRMLDDYVERECLVNPTRPDTIVLDGPLTDALYKKKKGSNNEAKPPPPESILRKDLAKLWASKMDLAYALVEMPGSRILELKRGTPPKVEIEVSMRQSRKFVTRIRGLEDYGIDPIYFSKDVAKRFACAAAVDTDAVGRAALKKGRAELIFQGNLSAELEALLIDETLTSHGGAKDSDYCLPKNVIALTLRKGVPGYKKVGESEKNK